MSDQDDGSGTAPIPGHNAGQTLVARYRAERLRQRPTLQVDLRAQRAALRQGRIDRLAKVEAAPSLTTPEEYRHVTVADLPSGPAAPDNEPSIFAKFVGDAPRHAEAAPGPVTDGPAEFLEAPVSVTPDPVAEPAVAPHPVNQRTVADAGAGDTALADIGFGPGMVLRFSQLGIANAADLARADAMNLRDSLGDISRLINVEFWIESARRACGTA